MIQDTNYDAVDIREYTLGLLKETCPDMDAEQLSLTADRLVGRANDEVQRRTQIRLKKAKHRNLDPRGVISKEAYEVFFNVKLPVKTVSKISYVDNINCNSAQVFDGIPKVQSNRSDLNNTVSTHLSRDGLIDSNVRPNISEFSNGIPPAVLDDHSMPKNKHESSNPTGGYPATNVDGYAPNVNEYPTQNGVRGNPSSSFKGYPPNNNAYPPNGPHGYPPNGPHDYPPNGPHDYPPNDFNGYPANDPNGYLPNGHNGYPLNANDTFHGPQRGFRRGARGGMRFGKRGRPINHNSNFSNNHQNISAGGNGFNKNYIPFPKKQKFHN